MRWVKGTFARHAGIVIRAGNRDRKGHSCPAQGRERTHNGKQRWSRSWLHILVAMIGAAKNGGATIGGMSRIENDRCRW
ncbi:hypothetical protein AA21291_0791 [Swaminathania salitolerans LMG 21291]|uniref:Uncharacterized protein n=1 Tax=Swaminathania salitolerans TaxID=182838 RepID=A0A511BQ33_9PROT|nr:hypothetical protein AA21291_0791 [Swaminathania salitolerans LMG 21291]GEL02451.1 hypothetical protein SSA02_16140 [Swaminathania salitolerans]